MKKIEKCSKDLGWWEKKKLGMLGENWRRKKSC